MNSRKLQATFLVAGIVAAGIAAISYVSTQIEKENVGPTRASVNLASLKTGSFVEIELPAVRVFVLRDFDELVYVFSVPYSDTAYWLPEFDWSRPAVACADFAPDNKDGMLIEDGKFRCRLPDLGEFFRREYAWSYSGKNLGYRTADMKIADYEISGEFVLLSQWR